jgi:hypothetical protein
MYLIRNFATLTKMKSHVRDGMLYCYRIAIDVGSRDLVHYGEWCQMDNMKT